MTIYEYLVGKTFSLKREGITYTLSEWIEEKEKFMISWNDKHSLYSLSIILDTMTSEKDNALYKDLQAKFPEELV